MREWVDRVRTYRERHRRWLPIVPFALGFLFDVVMLRRIDEPAVIVQQAAYLAVSIVLVGVELVELTREVTPPWILKRVWRHREFVLHFLLGTLLNSYTIFYFKSASAWSSFVFIGLLGLTLTATEFVRFGRRQVQVHAALVSLCLISFLVSLAPILMGFSGPVPLLLSVSMSALVFGLFYRALQPWFDGRPRELRDQLALPYAAVHLGFMGLYFVNAIPPVPLAVSYLGIYHGAEKQADGYHLTSTRSRWRFWEHGDQTFYARPGDTLVGYAQVFSPARFRDQLQIRWLLWSERGGWEPQDAIPVVVSGGREEGYRIATTKRNYQPGHWRLQVETIRSQEIGRIAFDVLPDEGTGEREPHVEIR